jgi:hypothetical protein
MNKVFLSNFLQVAYQQTRAERALAVDGDLSIIATINLSQADLLSERFNGIEIIRAALDDGQPVISNNIIMDPSEAPNTNTSFADLRLVVAIPIQEYGAIYLDQPLRKGVISREAVRRLHALAEQVVDSDQMEMDEAALTALYEQVI